MELRRRWHYKDTGEVALLPQFVFNCSTVLGLSSAIIGLFASFGLKVFSYDDASKGVFIGALVIASLSVGVMASCLREFFTSCETLESWEAEPSFTKKLSLLFRCGNNETPQRDNSSEETGKTGNHSFLRRLNVIKNFNLVDKFSRRKNTEEHHLLQAFNLDENSKSYTGRERLKQNSSVYGTTIVL